MLRRRRFEIELRVGIFVSLGVGLVMLAIMLLGGAESIATRYLSYSTYYKNVDSLIPGAKIILNGIRVGVVNDVGFDIARREIKVSLSISEDYSEWVRTDTIAEIKTQGVLGDKFIALSTDDLEDPILPPGSAIQTKRTGDLSQFIDKGENLMKSLNSIAGSLDRILGSFERNGRDEKLFGGLAQTAKQLSQASNKINRQMTDIAIKDAVNNLNSILGKIDQGQGTLGALVNDPSLYDDMKLLFGGANRNRVMRNLIRQTIKDGQVKNQGG